MRTSNIRIIGLVLTVCFGLVDSALSAELKLGGSRAVRALRGDTITVERLPLDGNQPNGFITMEPLRLRFDTDNVRSGSGAVAAAGEKLIYESDMGNFVLSLPANQVVADDLTLLADDGCHVRSFSFSVVGEAVPGLASGPYTVEYALYNNCPQAGGTGTRDPYAEPDRPRAIPGTQGVASFLDSSVINTIVKEIPLGTDVALPRTVWLGIKPNRNNVGVVGGAPPLVGFSGDIVDFPGSACNADAGGFPRGPHASFRAAVYGDASCTDLFPTYRNLSPARAGFNPGPRQCFADDLQLNTNDCQMVGIDVGVKLNSLTTTANVQFRMFRDQAGLPGPEIPGTFKTAAFTHGSGAYVARIKFDPPIDLPSDRVWLSYESASVGAGWILTRKDASIGATQSGYARSITGKRCVEMVTAPDWEGALFSELSSFGGFDVVVHCGGQAPVGACCDMYLTDDGFCSSGTCFGGEYHGQDCVADIDCQGDPICREIPQANCSFPPRLTNFRPRWQSGLSCRKCTGGANAGQTCSFADDCPGGTCTGPNPFTFPCGQASCCFENETGSERCENVLERECILKPPAYDPNGRQWQIGRYCSIDGQRCPRIACLGREGRCTEARPQLCNVSGVSTEEECLVDSDCGAECGPPICQGGTRAGLPCGGAGDCPPQIGQQNPPQCRQFCVGGSNAGQVCQGDDGQCNQNGLCVFHDPNDTSLMICHGGPNDGQVCEFSIQCPNGICSAKFCQGGARDLNACEEPRDCLEAICPGTPGCDNPLCCTAVCSREFQLGGTTLCCDDHWFEFCAQIALMISDEEGNDCIISPNNETCRPGDRTDGARVIALGESQQASMAATMHDVTEPAFCCHTGLESQCIEGQNETQVGCMFDEDCWSGGCARFCDTGFVGTPCTGAKRCTNPQNPGGGFGIFCDSAAECPVGHVCVAPECFVNGQGTCGPKTCDSASGTDTGDFCDTNADCNTSRRCRLRQPTPGALSAGASWYQFTIPPGDDPVNVEVTTCRSNSTNAHDSMIQVFGSSNSNSGTCSDLGLCVGNGDPCNVLTQNCSDGTTCEAERFMCSIAAQNCPLSRPCVPDLVTQCNSLVLLGCNDDDPDGCVSGNARPGNSRLCVSGLTPGNTYFIELGRKDYDSQFRDTDGVYRLDVTATTSCAGISEPNDSCSNATAVGDGEFAFDLGKASYDCPAPSCALGSRNDVWFRYTAPIDGMATFSTCDDEQPEMTPDTETALYLGCGCPGVNSVLTPIDCSSFANCGGGGGSVMFRTVQAGECYLVRVGDRNFQKGTGTLTITTLGEDCNQNGIEDVCDVDCNLPGCAVSGCGQSIDCNDNQTPDECEQDTGCCPTGVVTFVDPPAGVLDAGQPLDPYDGGVPLGITTIEVTAPTGAGPNCWSLCETASLGGANGLTVEDHGDDTYTLTLDRPITPGACTSIWYLAGDGNTVVGNFRSHPGNVDANSAASAGDVTSLVNYLNNIGVPPWGLYSSDVNRSGGANAADILALIDVLNGAGALTPWNNTSPPSCTICQPTQ